MADEPVGKPKDEELKNCIETLEIIATQSSILSQMSPDYRRRLLAAAGKVTHPDRVIERKRLKELKLQKRKENEFKDKGIRSATSIRATRRGAVFIAPPKVLESESNFSVLSRVLEKPRECYICKTTYKEVHFFYDSMCGTCSQFNYEKRFQTASLIGRIAIITGARLKIGYHAALMMLRAGAKVIVTTRFPHDAALRFSGEKDFSDWKDRLEVYGLDLRHSPSVEAFTEAMIRKLDRLDILINNAAQTVRRPAGFYAHLMSNEKLEIENFPEEVQRILSGCQNIAQAELFPGLTASAVLSQIPQIFDEKLSSEIFPSGKLDADLQQIDYRKTNSWRLKLAEVPTSEMLEVQLVNSVAPFILCSKLKPLMMKHQTNEKHIVNVSAMEGKFSRHTKTDRHPHTNMAKAALNMMTLTSARDYAQSGIFMNAVDTGWVTDEDPAEISSRKQENHDFQPPLDIVDGAARICDPFFSGILSGKHSWGNFLKDYYPTPW